MTETRITSATHPAPLMASLELADSEKLASGLLTSLTEANVWQKETLTPEMRWGNDYMHARYYSPTLARFVSVDPVGGTIGSSQSWNRYSYVLNNPLSFVDPDGQRTKVSETVDDDGNSNIEVYTEIEFFVEGANPEDYAEAAASLVSEMEAAWSGSVINADGTTTTVNVDINWAVTEGGGQLTQADQIQLVDAASGQGSQIFEGNVGSFGSPAFRSTASLEGGNTRGRINLFERSNSGIGTDYPGVAPHEYGHLVGAVYHYGQGGRMNRSSRDVMFNTLRDPSHYRIQPAHVKWLKQVARRQAGG